MTGCKGNLTRTWWKVLNGPDEKYVKIENESTSSSIKAFSLEYIKYI